MVGALLWAGAAAQQPSAAPAAPHGASIDAANQALAAGDYQKALELLDTLHKQDPKNPEVLYDLGLATEALHPEAATQPEAEADYRAAIAANPLFPLPHVALGLLLARAGHATDAYQELSIAARIPDIAPELKARALRAMARLDLNAHAPQSASGELLQALQLSPETPEDTLLAAQIARATPDLAASEQEYRKYLAAVPGDTAAVSALAEVLVDQHRPAEAETLLEQSLATHPGDTALLAQLATTLLASGDPEKVAQAAPLLEKLHAGQPDNANITRLLARLYVETGHPELADPLYARLVGSAGPGTDPTLLDEYGEALLREHRPGEAEKVLQKAVAGREGFPDGAAFADAAMRLAFAAEEMDDPAEALRALKLRATVQPTSLASLFLEATARDALHQSTQAANLYKQFLAEAHGTLPEQEKKARERLAALQNRR